MMKEIRYSRQFKKDFKRYRHDMRKVTLLADILKFLSDGIELPSKYKAHTLRGEYAGCMECHIGPDFLLIWRDEKMGIIYLVRLGSHSELFD